VKLKIFETSTRKYLQFCLILMKFTRKQTWVWELFKKISIHYWWSAS